MLTTLLRAELAVGMTLARGASSYAEITLRYGAKAAGALVDGLQTPDRAGQFVSHQAGAQLLSGYRDYLHEVSALARLMSLAVFDEIEQLRRAEESKQQGGPTHRGSKRSPSPPRP
jgi:hypothetical protein